MRSQGNLQCKKMIKSFGYRKYCTRWIPRLWIKDHKFQRPSSEISNWRRWISDKYYDRRWKLAPWLRAWNKTPDYGMPTFGFTIKEESKDMRSARRVMSSVFWDTECRIRPEFIDLWQTNNVPLYVQTLLKLRRGLREKRPGKKIIRQHDNAQPHTVKKAALTWHSPTTIFPVLLRNNWEANTTIR